MEIWKEGWFWAAVAALVVVGYLKFQHWREVSRLKKEKAELKSALEAQILIITRQLKELPEEVEALKRENENLRVSLKVLSQSSGKQERMQLETYERAIHRMVEVAPGFAPAWEKVMQTAEAEIEEVMRGERSFTGKIRGALSYITQGFTRKNTDSTLPEHAVNHPQDNHDETATDLQTAQTPDAMQEQ